MNLTWAMTVFAAGFLAVLVFHQGLYALLYHGGIIPKAKPPAPSNAPWDMLRVPPLGIPRVLSSAFWGGVWALVLMPLLQTFTGGAYWLAWFVVGGLALTLVFFYVVAPAKGMNIPFSLPRFGVGFALNGAWGLGTAWLARLLGGTG